MRGRRSSLTLREAALAVVQRLQEVGCEAYFAGGCVRDMLLGNDPKDYDVATAAPPQQVIDLFTRTRKVGVSFGVVMVQQGRHWIETATFRTDMDYHDGRHPDHVEFTTAENDAQRRDFTINGLFYDPIADRVIDYVDGRKDLQAGIIRAIGRPADRFSEDHLRMLRAVRFAERLGFEIETDTARAIREQAAKIERISPERIADELDRMLSHPARARAFQRIVSLGLIGHLGIGHCWPPVRVDSIVRALCGLPENADVELSLSTVLADCPQKEVLAIGSHLRFSNRRIDGISWLVAHQHDPARAETMSLADFKRLLAHDRFDDLLALYLALQSAAGQAAPGVEAANTRRAGIAPERIAPPPLVTGEDLIEHGLEPGPVFKRILDELYELQLNEHLLDRNIAMARMRDIANRS